MRALILAAGAGTRLLPLTKRYPKPLLPVASDTPLLLFLLENLKRHGFERCVVNCSHLAEQFRVFSRSYDPAASFLHLLDEPELLETGGSLLNARSFFEGEESFWVLNGDIYARPSFKRIETFHRGHCGLATLLLQKMGKRRGVTSLTTDESGLILSVGDVLRKGVRKPGRTTFFFCGIQVLRSSCFAYLPEGNRESLTELLFKRWLQEDIPFYGYEYKGVWSDIGTPQEYLRLNFLLNRKRAGKGKRKFLDYSNGKAVISRDITMRRVLLLDVCRLSGKRGYKNTILLSGGTQGREEGFSSRPDGSVTVVS